MYHTCSLVFQVTQPMSIDNCSIAYRGQRSLEVKVGQRNGTVQIPDAALGMRLCSSSSESGDGAFLAAGLQKGRDLLFLSAADT